MNTLMILTSHWDLVFGQDGWLLATFFSWAFMNQDRVEIHKLVKKKKENEANSQLNKLDQ